jgi:hypothetical protein
MDHMSAVQGAADDKAELSVTQAMIEGDLDGTAGVSSLRVRIRRAGPP